MKVLPDGARHATYIIIKHAMRTCQAIVFVYTSILLFFSPFLCLSPPKPVLSTFSFLLYFHFLSLHHLLPGFSKPAYADTRRQVSALPSVSLAFKGDLSPGEGTADENHLYVYPRCARVVWAETRYTLQRTRVFFANVPVQSRESYRFDRAVFQSWQG